MAREEENERMETSVKKVVESAGEREKSDSSVEEANPSEEREGDESCAESCAESTATKETEELEEEKGPCVVEARATDDPEEEAKVEEPPANIPENDLSFSDAMKSKTYTEAIEDVAGAVLQRLLKTRRPKAESRPKGKSRARPRPPPPADEDIWDLTWLESPKSDTSSPKQKRSKPKD